MQTSGAINCARRISDAGPSITCFSDLIESDLASAQVGRVRRSGPKRPRAIIAKPEKILQAFNTWAFKREQPDNTETMLQTIADAMKHDRPIQFVLYWGKGPRNHLDTPDTTCLDYLNALVQRVGAVYGPSASVRLIFTDTHAVLNGHSSQNIKQYFTAVAAAASVYGFGGSYLSEFVAALPAAGATSPYADSELAEDTRQRLIACASKWFKGGGTSEEGALRYFQMNLIEKRAVEHAFPAAVFVTFNGSEFRCLFPDHLPIFYMYSLRRGVSAKPWFLSSEQVGGDPVPAACG